MKLKNIVYVVLAAIMAFSSCTFEESIIKSAAGEEGIPTSFDLTLSSDGVLTKADLAPGYKYATVEEIQIQNLAVAVFKVDTKVEDGKDVDVVGEQVGFTYHVFPDGESNATCEDNRPAYKLEGVKARTGKVKILVVANSSKTKEQLEAITTYTGFKGVIEDNGSYEFSPTNLVKFAEEDATLSLTQESLHIRLTQLAARIDVSFYVDVPKADTITTITETYPMDVILESIKKGEIPNTDDVHECQGNKELEEKGDIHENHSPGKYLVVKNNKVTTTKAVPVWEYIVSSVRIKNINTQSSQFLEDYAAVGYTDYNYNTEEVILGDYVLTVGEDGLSKILFYTYEKSDKTDSPLEVYFSGDLINREKLFISEVTYDSEYRWNSATPGNGWTRDGYFSKESEVIIGTPSIKTGYGERFNERNQKDYKLVINPSENIKDPSVPEDEKCTTNGVVHGNTYEIIGRISFDTMNVTFTINVATWGSRVVEIGADISNLHYLFVKETKVYMPNINEYYIEYFSDSKIEIKDGYKVSYTEFYIPSGSNVVKSRPAYITGGAQYPSITVEGGKIKISSTIPTNYFPKDIALEVENEAGLKDSIWITQYPPQYLTAETSVGGGYPVLGGEAPDLKSNPNLFTITVIAPGDLIVGDPKNYSTTPNTTLTTEEANNMVSPKFVLASRYAVVSSGSFTSNELITRCKGYWETLDASKTGDNATYPPGTWRVPTLAELEFMSKIQRASSAVNYLFNDDGTYWSARQDLTPNRRAWFYDFGTPKRGSIGDSYGGTSAFDRTLNSDLTGTSGGQGGARCVRDVY
ncbi:hypothetical protein LJC39_02595 [Parabacteroides sp. OttesenSCG-928-B22]|nr:hypothetical protein [Parabacteroides sp. OttesenSCG-928-B22]